MLTISLPIPKSCNPNGQHGHWRNKSKARAAERQAAGIEVLAALRGAPAPRWQAGQIRCVWTAKSSVHLPDEGNAHARLKPIIDSLVDAGVFTDDKHVTTQVVREVRRDVPPGVVLHIEPRSTP